MENATRALTMAASVMIALVIISAILLVFNNLSNYQKTSDKLEKDEKVIEFNNQFETYNRTDVRGSDLLSLINRILDYNERQSFAGIEGSDLGYKPIKLTIDLTNNLDNIRPPLTGSDSGYTPLLKVKYEVTGKNNDDMEEVLDVIKTIEGKYNKTDLTKLCVAISSIFLDKSSLTAEQKKEVERQYYQTTNDNKTYNDIESMRYDVYKYYEYIQFKRTYFNCSSDNEGKTSGVTYDNNGNGRIIEMNFVGNGKVE